MCIRDRYYIFLILNGIEIKIYYSLIYTETSEDAGYLCETCVSAHIMTKILKNTLGEVIYYLII